MSEEVSIWWNETWFGVRGYWTYVGQWVQRERRRRGAREGLLNASWDWR
jgi:hypothetical protein